MKKAHALCLQNHRVLILDTEISKVKTGVSVVDNAEGYDSIPPVFEEGSSAIAAGSSADGYITASDFGNAVNGLGIENKSDGIAYHAVFGKVESGISASRGQSAIGTISHLAESNEGISTHSNADTISTGSCFSDAEEGMGVGQRNETIYTTEPIFAEGVTGIGAGDNAETKKVATCEFSQTESGMGTLQSTEATVDQPAQYIIYAGTYASQDSFTEVPDLNYIYVNGYVVWQGDTYPFRAFRAYDGLFSTIGGTPESPTYEGWGSLIDVSLVTYAWDIWTDDGTFTLTEDVSVTAEQYAAFSSYFKLATP